MNYKEITYDVIAQVSGAEQSRIKPSLDLVADLGIDSVKAMELLIELEEKLDIEISDSETQLNTVADVLNGVKELCEQK